MISKVFCKRCLMIVKYQSRVPELDELDELDELKVYMETSYKPPNLETSYEFKNFTYPAIVRSFLASYIQNKGLRGLVVIFAAATLRRSPSPDPRSANNTTTNWC